VNRGAEDPNLVVIYLQANTVDQLRAFTSSADLKETMTNAGVTSAPSITFAQGQEWGN
jgi:hypothetical protein